MDKDSENIIAIDCAAQDHADENVRYHYSVTPFKHIVEAIQQKKENNHA